ncbi:MAG: hypothetical protein OXM54_15630 [Acidimicrobiaceae bacterium]|nr:hypothetical protein [Acidimicrobiaceae bacterium]
MAPSRSAEAAVVVGAHEPENGDEPPNALWRYVPALRCEDDEWRLRLVLHDFGLVWEDTPIGRRSALVSREPDGIDPRWDAFLAAYVEHRCISDGLEPPAWTLQRERQLREFWYAGGCHDYDRVRTIVTTPITFEAHGIWFPREELTVV